MKLNTIGLIFGVAGLVCACGDDSSDESTNTTDAMTTAAETTSGTPTEQTGSGSESETDNGTAGTAGTSDTEGGETSQPGDTTVGETTGSGAEVCDTCDPATEYCFESIIDGPSIFDCREIPADCSKDATCDCIAPIACPESLQACIDDTPILVECVEG